MSSLTRSKSGANVKHYETSDFIKHFEPIRRALADTVPDVTAKSLAQLTAELLTFQESALGRDVRTLCTATTRPIAPPSLSVAMRPLIRSRLRQGDCRDLTKLPLKLFHDYSPEGSLRTILSACFTFKEAQHLRRFEFQNPQKKERNLQLIGLIEETLVVTS